MRWFISWSGRRSQAVGNCLRNWLPQVIPGIEFFHSQDITKGANWHEELTKALRGCPMGIFCITPENAGSQWMLFEAGALAQQGDQPTLFTYTFGHVDLAGPFGHFQATRFDRDDTLRLVHALAKVAGSPRTDEVEARFAETWESFRTEVNREATPQLEELIPGFSDMFDGRKTFEESFPDCTNRRWDDRLRRVVRNHERLSDPGLANVMAGAPGLEPAYRELVVALDRYDMNIGALLLRPVEFADLPEADQARLEKARLKVVDLVRTLKELSAGSQ